MTKTKKSYSKKYTPLNVSNVHRRKKRTSEKKRNQQYPPGTQGNYDTFSSIIPITQNGKTLEVPKGGRGPKGLESSEAGFGRPGVPPMLCVINVIKCRYNKI